MKKFTIYGPKNLVPLNITKFERIKNFIDNKNFRLDYKFAKFHLKDEINKGRNIN